ncbi:MAG: hypothetical protein ACRCZB_05020 [Bacteroidales bacterium]
MAVYIDYEHTGSIDEKGNLKILYDQEALTNAIKLWVCSFRGERLYKPTKGGFIVGALLKPMSEERSQDIQKDIVYGLATDFRPSITVNECSVVPDFENSCYYIKIVGYCPSFKSDVETELRLNNLLK